MISISNQTITVYSISLKIKIFVQQVQINATRCIQHDILMQLGTKMYLSLCTCSFTVFVIHVCNLRLWCTCIPMCPASHCWVCARLHKFFVICNLGLWCTCIPMCPASHCWVCARLHKYFVICNLGLCVYLCVTATLLSMSSSQVFVVWNGSLS